MTDDDVYNLQQEGTRMWSAMHVAQYRAINDVIQSKGKAHKYISVSLSLLLGPLYPESSSSYLCIYLVPSNLHSISLNLHAFPIHIHTYRIDGRGGV